MKISKMLEVREHKRVLEDIGKQDPDKRRLKVNLQKEYGVVIQPKFDLHYMCWKSLE